MPRRAIEDVNVLDPYGDSFLNHEGIGHANVNGTGQITQADCGIFAVNKPLPSVGKQYVITGKYADPPKIDFKVTLSCTTSARPVSIFS